ncbi:nuclease-related domain-containing protein [Burkholderia humptydooensis]|uniref:nuclease-related domain-containing protein n=1 Tax=Burkholderia humptydooensis TaxID=430531 RepID=UPI0007246A47|nr:nuclease-related domain-containing protein [Burkholderia humptydooensis]KST72203.1 hypothetical protein WS76_27295 [Burkholderia humptydooensis]
MKVGGSAGSPLPFMSSIELYCGAEIEPDSEKRVLIALFEHLDARGLPAVVLSNFTIGRCQIDFLVGTESTTLLLEVKGFRVPVIGFVNGSWSSVSPDGSLRRERNGWDQALKNKYAVRKRLGVEMSGRWIPYPNAAVLFEAGIAPGSMFDEMDHEWVAIRGIERLGELLAARAGEPWPLDWLRLLAGTLNLDRSTLQLAVAGPARLMAGRPPFAAESPRTFEPSGAAAPAPFDASAPPNPSQPVVVPSTIRTDEGLPRALPADVAPARRGVVRRAAPAPAVWSPAATSDAHAARSSNAAARPGLPSVATAVRPARGERARRLPLGVFVLLSAAAFVWRSDTRAVPPNATAVAASQTTTVKPPRPHRPKRHVASKPRRTTAPARTDTARVGAAADAAAVAERPASAVRSESPPTVEYPVSCPPGVDRLGCNGRVDPE